MPEATHPAHAFAPASADLPATWENVDRLFESADFTGHTLPALLREARWFGGKAYALVAVRAIASLPLGELAAGRLILLEAIYEDHPAETYVLPLQLAPIAPPNALIVARMSGGFLFDALTDENFRATLIDLIFREKRISTGNAAIVGICGAALAGRSRPMDSRVIAAEQSNSAIIYGDRYFLKLYRKPAIGENPDAELIRFLSERQGFAHVPAFCGAIEYCPAAGQSRTLALLVANVPSTGDAWAFTLASLRRQFDGSESGALYLARARQLGTRTGEMHVALAADSEDPAFAPEPFSSEDRTAVCDSAKAATKRTMELLGKQLANIPEADRPNATALLHREGEILARLATLAACEITATKTRHHGDYHLGQVLDTGADFVIIDFEGEPARSIEERRMKRSPLRDVAGMLRSFHYAAHSAIPHPASHEARAAAETWTRKVAQVFLDAWLAATTGASFVPTEPAALQALLTLHLIEKAIYEVAYELNNRPGWVFIPVLGLAQLLDDGITSSP